MTRLASFINDTFFKSLRKSENTVKFLFFRHVSFCCCWACALRFFPRKKKKVNNVFKTYFIQLLKQSKGNFSQKNLLNKFFFSGISTRWTSNHGNAWIWPSCPGGGADCLGLGLPFNPGSAPHGLWFKTKHSEHVFASQEQERKLELLSKELLIQWIPTF